MDLDLSVLTDDQLVELARLVIDEALHRNAGTAAAAEDYMLTAADKLRIVRASGDQAARVARAMERERVAAAAQARISADQERQREEIRAAQAKAERERLAHAVAALRSSCEQLAVLLDADMTELTFVRITKDGAPRLLIESSGHRLCDWIKSGKISTPRDFVRKKPELAGLCATIWDLMTEREINGAAL